MHYRASGRHYLMEATNADYNVIKTSVDATYKTTLNKYLMAGVSLIEPVDGKPTKIEFIPTNPLGTITAYSKIMGQNYEKEVKNPTYKCGGTRNEGFVDADGKVSVTYWDGDLGNYQTEYAASIGAPNDEAKRVARNEVTNELSKIGAAACKAIDDLSKGIPNPLVKLTTTTKPEEKKALPATKGTGKIVSHRLISAKPTTVITAEDFKKVGLSSEWIPTIDDFNITKISVEAPYGGSFYFGPSNFNCGPGTGSDSGKPAYRLGNDGADLYEPLKSAWAAYKKEIKALFIKQCQANAEWLKTAKYQYENEKGEVIKTGPFNPQGGL